MPAENERKSRPDASERRARALRDNLRRRKVQERERSSATADEAESLGEARPVQDGRER
ncbi:MAG: hypothetical protein GHHEDOFH_00245 [Pseudorhodoplanes sp.]|nr:hypothetical protein [Pseudorhodoplanes sp.]